MVSRHHVAPGYSEVNGTDMAQCASLVLSQFLPFTRRESEELAVCWLK